MILDAAALGHQDPLGADIPYVRATDGWMFELPEEHFARSYVSAALRGGAAAGIGPSRQEGGEGSEHAGHVLTCVDFLRIPILRLARGVLWLCQTLQSTSWPCHLT